MDSLTPSDFKSKDIVYAEGYIQRYLLRTDGNKKYLSRDNNCLDWAKIPYRVGLELVAMSLIASPSGVREAEVGEIDM